MRTYTKHILTRLFFMALVMTMPVLTFVACSGGVQGIAQYNPEIIGIELGRDFRAIDGKIAPGASWQAVEGRDTKRRALHLIQTQKEFVYAFDLERLYSENEIPAEVTARDWFDHLELKQVLVTDDYARAFLAYRPPPSETSEFPMTIWLEYNVERRRGEYIYLVAE